MWANYQGLISKDTPAASREWGHRHIICVFRHIKNPQVCLLLQHLARIYDGTSQTIRTQTE